MVWGIGEKEVCLVGHKLRVSRSLLPLVVTAVTVVVAILVVLRRTCTICGRRRTSEINGVERQAAPAPGPTRNRAPISEIPNPRGEREENGVTHERMGKGERD